MRGTVSAEIARKPNGEQNGTRDFAIVGVVTDA